MKYTPGRSQRNGTIDPSVGRSTILWRDVEARVQIFFSNLDTVPINKILATEFREGVYLDCLHDLATTEVYADVQLEIIGACWADCVEAGWPAIRRALLQAEEIADLSRKHDQIMAWVDQVRNKAINPRNAGAAFDEWVLGIRE